MRLITIRISHFNERARLALDRFGVAYDEEPYMPLFHFAAVARVTRGRGGKEDRHSSRFSTPVLVTDEGLTLCDSGEIVRWADDSFGSPESTLYPPALRDEVAAFEHQVHDRLGGHARRVAYHILFGNPALLGRLAARNVGAVQARLFQLAAPAVIYGIQRRLEVQKRYQVSLDKVRTFLDELDARVAGRAYTFGDRFSAADLTLSALLAPLVLPSRAEGFGASLPALDELSAEGAAFVREVRERPVGQLSLRMFATERGARRVPCSP